MTQTATWSYPTAIRFGAGRIKELAEACRTAAIVSPLIVTDRGVAALPILAAAREALDDGGMPHAVFAEVDPNPVEANLTEGIAAYRAGGHDGVIAFGGGSAMDLGKLVAFMAGQTRPVWDFEDVGDWWQRANSKAIAPVVAVPTTAGTGSELGRAGVLTRAETQEKKIIFHPSMLPKVVIADPALTLGLPPAITAGTGMDAFAHCFEAFCSPHFHPMSQGIALEGMRLVLRALPRAVADGSDLEARAELLTAAGMGAVAFQKGLGAVHALSHPVGAVYGTHHGTTNAVVLPAVMDFNRDRIVDRVAEAAGYLGVDGGLDGLRARIVAMNAEFGMPDGLAAMGVEPARLDDLTRMALADPSVGGNPRPMDFANTRALFEAAL
jgi:alcohol dehydrogenase class IV